MKNFPQIKFPSSSLVIDAAYIIAPSALALNLSAITAMMLQLLLLASDTVTTP
jgi:hypothetical protein